MTQPDGTADRADDDGYYGGSFEADDATTDDTDALGDEAGTAGGIDADGPAPEGQTARDVLPEDDGIPEVSQDDSPTMERAEDPEFAPLPRETPGATLDFGTTALEQSEGESLSDRLDREVPDDAVDVRPAEDPARPAAQLEQDEDADPFDDSGTNRTGDDVTATGDPVIGGEGPEAGAVHVTEG
jgi:hypothetical protein